MPTYSFHSNSEGTVFERRVPVNDYFLELHLHTIVLEPIGRRFEIYNLVVLIEETGVTHTFTLSQLFYNPMASGNTLFFRNNGQDYARIELPDEAKNLKFTINVRVPVEPFTLNLNCDYHR